MAKTAVAHVLTDEERARVLELVAAGRNRAEAAEAIGMTGTKLRQLIGRDDNLRAAFEEAKAEGKVAFADELLGELRRRVLGAEGEGGTSSDRLLQWALATYEDEWRWSRGRAAPEGEDVGASGLPRISVNLDLLTDGQAGELRTLLERLDTLVAIGQGRLTNPELAEIEAA